MACDNNEVSSELKRAVSIPSKESPKEKTESENYSLIKYCNYRFSFCLSYPASFHPMGESDNGDGQSFKTNDGNALISSYGGLVISEDEFNWNLETEH